MTRLPPLRLPGSRDRSDALFLSSLGSLLAAGLRPAEALEQPGCRRLLAGRDAGAACAALRRGGSLAASLRILELDEASVARIEAAEAAGRVPEALAALAREKERAAEAIRRTLARSLYPLFVIHFAAVVAELPLLLSGSRAAALGGILAVLVPVDAALAAAAALLAGACRGGAAAGPLSRVPGLAGWLRDRALVPFLRALADLYESGRPLDRAVEAAAAATPSPFRERLAAAALEVRAGNPLAPALRRSAAVDETTLALLEPAEFAGETGSALARAAQLVEERLDRSSGLRSRGPGAILFFVAALLVLRAGYKILVAPLLGALSQLPS